MTERPGEMAAGGAGPTVWRDWNAARYAARRSDGQVEFCTWLPDRRPLYIGVVRRGVPSSSAVSSSASSSPATSTDASVSVARLNATRRLIDARSSVVEPLQRRPARRGTTTG